MSIWCSRLAISDTPFPEDGPAPIVYQGSHILPRPDAERGGSVDTAAIPGFLTYDGYDDASDGESMPWWPYLRLSVTPAQGPTFGEWERLHRYANEMEAAYPDLAAAIRLAADAEDTVILDLTQVDALIADLTQWRANVKETP